MEQLLVNALFAKCHCVPSDEAQVFKTFIEHNYQMQVDFDNLGSQDNWLKTYRPEQQVSLLILIDVKLGLTTAAR